MGKQIYILSSPHGGSTLLSLVLGNNPDIANLGELSLMHKHLSLNEPCTCGVPVRECKRWGKLFVLLKDKIGVDMRDDPYRFYLGDAFKTGAGKIDHEYQNKTRHLMANIRSAIDIVSLNGPKIIGRHLVTKTTRNSIRNTIIFYEAAGKAWKKKVIVDASKFPRKATRLYMECPESVRIVHLVRDGRGVVNSRKDYMSIAKAARKWRNYHRRTARYLDRWVDKEHWVRVRYEDFVKDPKPCLDRICGMAGLSCSDEMLVFGDGEFHSAGGNPARFGIKGGIRPADERWRKELDSKQLAVFARIAGHVNKQFGYR